MMKKLNGTKTGEKQFFDYLEKLPTDILFFIEERWAPFYADKKLQSRYYPAIEGIENWYCYYRYCRPKRCVEYATDNSKNIYQVCREQSPSY